MKRIKKNFFRFYNRVWVNFLTRVAFQGYLGDNLCCFFTIPKTWFKLLSCKMTLNAGLFKCGTMFCGTFENNIRNQMYSEHLGFELLEHHAAQNHNNYIQVEASIFIHHFQSMVSFDGPLTLHLSHSHYKREQLLKNCAITNTRNATIQLDTAQHGL